MAQDATPAAKREPDTQICAPGNSCCAPTERTDEKQLSWPIVLGITAAGTLMCVVIAKLLGA